MSLRDGIALNTYYRLVMTVNPNDPAVCVPRPFSACPRRSCPGDRGPVSRPRHGVRTHPCWRAARSSRWTATRRMLLGCSA